MRRKPPPKRRGMPRYVFGKPAHQVGSIKHHKPRSLDELRQDPPADPDALEVLAELAGTSR